MSGVVRPISQTGSARRLLVSYSLALLAQKTRSNR